MKLVRAGRDQKGWAQEFTCSGEGTGGGGCLAVLLVDSSDIYLRANWAPNQKVFKCMCCGVESTVSFVPHTVGNISKEDWEAKQEQTSNDWRPIEIEPMF